MMFRRLYWVTEQLSRSGEAHVHGVYTSIPDLLRRGIGEELPDGFRLNLVKLDNDCGPLGSWEAPTFDGLGEKLSEYVVTDEFSPDQVETLLSRLGAA